MITVFNDYGCDNWVLSGSPEPTMVGFRDLVGVGISPVSKKLAVKNNRAPKKIFNQSNMKKCLMYYVNLQFKIFRRSRVFCISLSSDMNQVINSIVPKKQRDRPSPVKFAHIVSASCVSHANKQFNCPKK